MRIRTLLLILILYATLAWIWAAYSYSGKEFVDHGLLWTAAGVAAVLGLVVGEWLWTRFRAWRALRATQPKGPVQPPTVVHPDDASLTQLFSEARARLLASPQYGAAGKNIRLENLPLTLLVGPPGGGKTSALLHSGIEAHLLAGQAYNDAGVAATPVANFSVANEELFVEIAGRIWNGDLNRWREFLQGFLPRDNKPWWKRWPNEAEEVRPRLRAVVLFVDLPGVKNGAPDDTTLIGRQAHERLQTLSAVFGIVAPVYVVFTHADALPYYADFFGRMPESEAGQAVGAWVAGPGRGKDAQSADAETKRLTRAFGLVANRLSDSRLVTLVRESDSNRKPGIYEFPREFRRVRGSVVQFLAAACRPDPLKTTHILRGFYFTGTRQVEGVASVPQTQPGATSAGGWAATEVFHGQRPGATQIFRLEATQIFRPEDAKHQQAGGGGAFRRQWMFVREILQAIIPGERALSISPRLTQSPLEKYSQLILAGAATFCLLLILVWLQSWWQNRARLAEVSSAMQNLIAVTREPGSAIPMDSLSRLDKLRGHLVRLDGQAPWSMRWGLYAGDSIRPSARLLYFRKVNEFLLADLDHRMTGYLGRLPAAPSITDPPSPAYDYLSAHLALAGTACPFDVSAVRDLLKSEAVQAGISTDDSFKEVVDRQIDYFAGALAKRGVPTHLPEDAGARDNARAYLRKVMNLQRVYCAIIAEANRTYKPVALSDILQDYGKALAVTPRQSTVGPCLATLPLAADQMAGAYTREAVDFVEKEAQRRTRAGFGDPCVMGSSSGNQKGEAASDAHKEVLRLYIEDYKAQWKALLSRFSIAPYGGIGDAIRKLELLSNYRSPLLGLFAFASNQTYYASRETPSAASTLSKTLEKTPLRDLRKKADETESKLAGKDKPVDPPQSPVKIRETFDSVHRVVPPASEQWKNEKNAKYLDALSEIQQGLIEMARAGGIAKDPTSGQKALAAYDKARAEVRLLATGELKPIGSEGIDAIVLDLLEQPVIRAKRFIPDNPEQAATGGLKRDTAALCSQMQGVWSKYPFSARSTNDATLQDVAGLLAPETGAVWQYVQKSLGELVSKQGNQWVQKPDAEKPKLSDELMRFLNRAQSLTDAFYRGGATQPSLRYSIRPQDGALERISVQLEFDGRTAVYSQDSVIRKEFIWPAPPGVVQGAVARQIAGGVQFPFGRSSGLWGVFRVFGGAQPRAVGDKKVEWRYVRGAGNEQSPLDVPVRLEFVDFPGGLDLFNPEFFRSLGCPSPTSVVQ